MEVSELIQQADIVDYISQYCALTERSDGEWWGLSPLKAENTPLLLRQSGGAGLL